MDAAIFDLLLHDIAADFVGRTLTRVLPAERSGIVLVFDGAPGAVRLETWPPPGVLFVSRERASRLKGGRGVWPDLTAAADAVLAGRELRRVERGARPDVARFEFDDDASVSLVTGARGGIIVLDLPGQARRTLPGQIKGAVREPESLHEAPADETVAEVRGAWLVGPEGFPDGEARSSWAGRLRVVADDSAPPGDEAQRYESVHDAVAEWLRRTAACAALAERAAAAGSFVRREIDRTRRAIDAVRRDEEQSPAPDAVRRMAEALLAAGPAALLTSDGVWRTPDPYDPAVVLEIPAQPAGAPPHGVAQRLFDKARKIERGKRTRALRTADLRAREGRLAAAAALAQAADSAADVAGLEQAAREIGFSPDAARAPAGPRPPRPRGEEAGPARVVRSPGGFEVLVGRSARQNDRLTFGVAGPEDYWFHAKGWAGAHVVLRCPDRAAPQEDLLFAARLAAAYSQAPDGEPVDVHVARRKHVRKVRGAPAGEVTVRKSTILRVRAERPREDGANRPDGARNRR